MVVVIVVMMMKMVISMMIIISVGEVDKYDNSHVFDVEIYS